jgi:hypothetical protein
VGGRRPRTLALSCVSSSNLIPTPAVKPEAERRQLEESREREFLREHGVKEEDLPKLTSQAVSNTCQSPNCRKLTSQPVSSVLAYPWC